MNKKKILFIEFLPIGGSTNALIDQIGYINKKLNNEYECVVITSPNSIFESARKKIQFKKYIYNGKVYSPNVNVNFLTMAIRYFLTLVFIVKVAIIERPKIIHAYHYMWSVYANIVGIITGIPVVVYLCDVWPLKNRLDRVLMRLNSRTHFIAVSKYVYDIFVKKCKIDKSRTYLIYDGADTKLFKPLDKNKIEKKQDTSLKNIVYFSRIDPLRDIDKFIETAAILLEKYPNLMFYHYGYHPLHSDKLYFAELQRMVKSIGIENKFKFMKYFDSKSDIPKVLKKAYLSLIPARQFALPNVAIESMMTSVPVVALSVGGNPEIIPSKNLGSLVSVSSPTLYAKSVEEYLKNKKHYMSVSFEAAEFVKTNFDINNRFLKTIQVYEEILN